MARKKRKPSHTPQTAPPAASPTPRFQREWLVCAVLAAATFAVYVQVHDFDFVNYDDTTLYIAKNPRTPSGLNWDNVAWAFTTGHASNWHPLTWLSHMVDVQLFGMKAGAHHMVSVLFHVANTLLLFLLMRRMAARWDPGRAFWQSAFAAAVFALHPLHVESAAWIAERKDVLSTFFWLLAMAGYLHYTKRPGLARYLLVAIPFALGLMAKPMVVTLPAVLLLLDYWPLRRQRATAVLEKLPLFVLALASSAVTVYAQQAGKAIAALDQLPVSLRVENALVSYVRYIMMTFWPTGLAPFYPHPGPGLPLWQAAVSALVLVGLTVIAVAWIRSLPYVAVGWFWFLGTLLPVIGIIQVGQQALADRYMYIPLIGLSIAVAWGAADLIRKWRVPTPAAAATSGAVLLALAACTALQTGHWRNSIALFEHALEVTSGNFLAHKNLGVALATEGRYKEASVQYAKAILIRSNDPDLYYNLANALDELGDTERAIVEYGKAVKIDPRHAQSHYNLGNALAGQQDFAGAAGAYRTVLEIEPDHLGATINLGNALAMLGRFEEAAGIFRKTIEMDPDNIESYVNLGNVLAQQSKPEEAVPYYTKALELDPRHLDTYCNLGYALVSQGKLEEAAHAFTKALEIAPGHAPARKSLEAVRAELTKPGGSGTP